MKAVTESFRMAKDSGFKVVSHMMPNLPNVDLERDLSQFKVTLLMRLTVVMHYFFYMKGIFRESRISSGWSQTLSHTCNPWNGPLRTMANKSLCQLSSIRSR